MSPDQINEDAGRIIYRCRPCKAESGLHWYNGTSCPVCSKPECTERLDAEWQDAYDALRREEDEWRRY